MTEENSSDVQISEVCKENIENIELENSKREIIFGNESEVTLLLRYQACMVLAGVGDALGYNEGRWEFCHSGETIMEEVMQRYKGIANLIPNGQICFILSDDTIMHIATAEALIQPWKNEFELLMIIAKEYVRCMNDMGGRAPGGSCISGTLQIRAALKDPKRDKEKPPFVTPYGTARGGCGAAMRSVPIGLAYSHEGQIDQLMKVSIESGRMTHNQTTGFLGSLATALLVHLAIRGVPPLKWGRIVLEQSERALQYCQDNDQYHRDILNIKRDWGYFQNSWDKYLIRRNIKNDGPVDFKFDYSEENIPDTPSYSNHDSFVTEVSYSGWGGSSGHDAPMLAYDAVLYALQVREKEGALKAWESLCAFGMFHCGDCDSTGIISAAIWGAMFGFEAYKANYNRIEYKERLFTLGEELYKKSEELLTNDPLASPATDKFEDPDPNIEMDIPPVDTPAADTTDKFEDPDPNIEMDIPPVDTPAADTTDKFEDPDPKIKMDIPPVDTPAADTTDKFEDPDPKIKMDIPPVDTPAADTDRNTSL